MKFTVNKKNLSDCVNNISRAVSSKTSIPALEGILIETINENIQLTAYDLELGMKTYTNATIIEEGKIVLPSKLFSDIVRKAPAQNISITINEKNIATIESGDSSFNIAGINPDEFPELPNIGSDESISISGEILKGMIKQTIFAVAENDSRPINQGSLFNFNNGKFDLVSVDGHRLAMRSENLDIDNDISFVVPGKTLIEVLKLCGENDIEIISSRRHIMFKVENYIIISSILEGEFLEYNNSIPTSFNTEITVKTRDFIESAERVSLLIADRLRSPIRCNFKDGEINLSCTTVIGKAKDKLYCEISGRNLEMGFNNKFLLDALKNTETDSIKISIVDALTPIVITPLEGDSFLFLVLPVRLSNEY